MSHNVAYMYSNSTELGPAELISDSLAAFGSGPGVKLSISNGIGWYISTGQSFGFVNGGDGPELNTADTAITNGQYRLSLHYEQSVTGGYRCCNMQDLNSNTSQE